MRLSDGSRLNASPRGIWLTIDKKHPTLFEADSLIAITADSHPYVTIWSCYGNDCIMNIQNFSNEPIRDRYIWSEFLKVISS